MKEFKTEVIIDAPIAKVWNVFYDFENYENWNPLIQVLRGTKVVGEKLELTITPKGKKPSSFKPVLLKNEREHEFRWKGSLGIKGLFDGEHYFIFKELENGSTQLTHGEKFTGILVRPLLALIGEGTHLGFIDMNNALKSKCEMNS